MEEKGKRTLRYIGGNNSKKEEWGYEKANGY